MHRFICTSFFLFFSAISTLANPQEWALSGLELVRAPPPIIDISRLRAQQAVGCAATKVRFGDTAFMRGFGLRTPWPETVRRLMSAAEMTDNPKAAYERYRTAIATPGLSEAQRAAIEEQWMLAALQFNDAAMAQQIEDSSSSSELPPQMQADRLFLSVLLRAGRATEEDWKGQLDTALAGALRRDKTHFGVRVWRVFAWFKGKAGTIRSGSCASELNDLQRRVLDVSEASPCPLMLGHFDHALSRFLSESPEDGPDRPKRAWHTFAAALLAEAAQNTARTDALVISLATQQSSGACRALMLDELNRMRKARKP